MMFKSYLLNTLADADSLLQSQKQAAGDIGIYLNANKTEFAF